MKKVALFILALVIGTALVILSSYLEPEPIFGEWVFYNGRWWFI